MHFEHTFCLLLPAIVISFMHIHSFFLFCHEFSLALYKNILAKLKLFIAFPRSQCVARLRYTKCAVFIYTLYTSLIHCRQKIIIVTVNLRLHVSLCCVVHQLCSFYAIKYCTVKNWTNYNKCMYDIIFVFSYHYPLRFDLTFTFSHNICKSSFSLYISLIVLCLSLEISNKREHHK